MARSLFVNRLPGTLRIALCEDGVLRRFQIHREADSEILGAVYLARVNKVLPGVGAAVVNLGSGEAFLNADRGGVAVVDGGRLSLQPQIKEGQAILALLSRSGLRDKLPTASSELKLVGAWCIFLPLGKGVRFSRDFKGDRAEVKKSIEGDGGWIIRGAAEGNREQLMAEMSRHREAWQSILVQIQQGKPRVLFQPHPLLSLINSDARTVWRAIHVDDAGLFEEMREVLTRHRPELGAVLKLHDGATPLFDAYRIEDEAAKLVGQRVWLKSGGTLDFHQTEAVVTVDVNTARNTKNRGGLSPAQRTNLEAAAEIARQTAARNLAGLIVIDFINARDPGWQKQLDKALKQAFAEDEVAVDIAPVNDLGVAVLSRQRKERDLNHMLHEHCPRCSGSGWITRLEALAVEIQRKLIREASDMAGESFQLSVGRELFEYLHPRMELLFGPIEQSRQITLQLQKAKLPARAYDISMA